MLRFVQTSTLANISSRILIGNHDNTSYKHHVAVTCWCLERLLLCDVMQSSLVWSQTRQQTPADGADRGRLSSTLIPFPTYVDRGQSQPHYHSRHTIQAHPFVVVAKKQVTLNEANKRKNFVLANSFVESYQYQNRHV